jgi:dolichol-phosphate mannosyltransferase
MSPSQRGEPVEWALVVIPTYNEIENLPLVLGRLHAAAPEVHALIVDDGSPDGTGALADEMAADRDWLHVLHRTTKEGLGAAYVAGMTWGLRRGYEAIVEMDADLSHRPEDVPRLLRELDSADVVLGSRWVSGGGVSNWPFRRKLLSKGGNLFAQVALGLPLRDATGGFRAYRREALLAIDLPSVRSQGYCFQIELAFRAIRAGMTVTELPIHFVDREHGVSKMAGSIVTESIKRLTVWGLQERSRQLRSVLRGRRPDAVLPVPGTSGRRLRPAVEVTAAQEATQEPTPTR